MRNRPGVRCGLSCNNRIGECLQLVQVNRIGKRPRRFGRRDGIAETKRSRPIIGSIHQVMKVIERNSSEALFHDPPTPIIRH